MMVATLRRPTEMLPNSAVEADVALAALGTTQLNASRYTDPGLHAESTISTPC
jgi:hypothetical protein